MPGNNHNVSITGLSHEGRGIAQIDGKTVFIENALPGENIDIEITKKHSRYSEGRVLQIFKPSPDRVTPKCIHFDMCGGCQLQHMSNTAQILMKQKTLLEQLKHIGHVEPQEILAPLRSPEWGYRYKGRLSVKYVDKKEKLLVGFHEKNGRYVAELTLCEVLHPKVGYAIESLKQMILSLSLFRQLPQIEIACDDKNTALIFRCLQDLTEQDKKYLREFGETKNFWIFIEPNKPQKSYKLWPEEEGDYLSYTLNLEAPVELHFHPTDFTQINPAINQQMVNRALELLDLKETDEVLDLFCGLGNFTLPIARLCKHVTGIEGEQKMVDRARANAKHNQLSNTSFFVSNLFEPNNTHLWMQKSYDKLLLDPPRSGAIEILPYVTTWKPKRIVYVSCNPATLARDAGELVNKYGYKLIKAGVMDMFPHTKHVESIILLTRAY